MPEVPDELRSADNTEDMLEAFSGLTFGRVSARFAILPMSSPEEGPQAITGWGIADWEIRQQDPYFALIWGAVEEDEDGQPPAEDPVVSDLPLAFAAVAQGCCVIASVANSRLFHRLLGDFVNIHYPEVGRAYWDTEGLFARLRTVESNESCSDFLVTGYSYRSPIGVEDGATLWESDRCWTQRTLQNAYAELAANNAWARRIQFGFKWRTEEDVVEASGSIGRDSIVAASSGVQVIWDEVLVPGIAAADEARERFRDRERGRSYHRPARPLTVRYGTPVFRDANANRLLIEGLRQLPDSSLSVYHGNPYLQASLVDHMDGSTFAVWVVEDDRIIVVPGARASTSAVERLVAHIMDQFREGEVGDLE